MTEQAIRSCPMEAVTGDPEWKPVLAGLRAAGIPVFALTVRRRHVGTEAQTDDPLRVEFEISHRMIERLDATRRAEIETRLRAAAPAFLCGPCLRIVWRKPVCAEWNAAYIAAGDALWRDWHRARVSEVAFRRARMALSVLHRRVSAGEDHAPLLPELALVLSEARRHPAPRPALPPPAPDEVPVEEAMAVLRRIADGSARPEIGPTPKGWKRLWHGTAEIRVDDWIFVAYRRHLGMRHVEEVRSPDGRRGTRASFAARQGDPFMLLEDAEQDAICAVLENGYDYVHGRGAHPEDDVPEIGLDAVAAALAPPRSLPSGIVERLVEMTGPLRAPDDPVGFVAERAIGHELERLDEDVEMIRSAFARSPL